MEEIGNTPPGTRGRRRLWIAVGILVALVGSLAIAIPMLLDVERHRERVEQTLRDVTGWEPELGEIRLSVLAGLRLSLSPASLTSPDGGSRIRIDAIRVSAAWGPLLAGRLEIDRIELLSPSIELERRDTKAGWPVPVSTASETGDAGANATPPAVSTVAPAAPTGATSPIPISIDSIEISNGTIRITDRTVEPATVVELLEVASRLEPETGSLRGSATLGSGRLEWDGALESNIEIRLTGLASEDLAAMIGPGLLQPGGILSGAVTYSQPLTLEGRVDIRQFWFDTGERALEEATVNFHLVEAEHGLHLESFEIIAGEARIHGTGVIAPDLSIEMEMPETPLGPALALARALFPMPLDLKEPGAASLRAHLFNDDAGELSYHAEGTLDAASLRLVEFLPDARDLRTKFALTEEGALDIELSESVFSGGPLTGTLSFDSVDPRGKLRCRMKLLRANLGELLAGFLPDDSGGIEGMANGLADITLDLSRDDPGPEAITGSLSLTTAKVTLPGWNVEKRIDEKLQKTLGGLAGLLGKKLSGDTDADGKSDAIDVFDRLFLEVNFDEPLWRLHPFRAQSGALSIFGDGVFDPGVGEIDLTFNASFTAERSSELVSRYKQLRYLLDDKGKINLPIEIDGPMMRPHIGIDIGDALLKGDGDEKDALKGLIKGLLDRHD